MANTVFDLYGQIELERRMYEKRYLSSSFLALNTLEYRREDVKT
jgi:hypothetical protein